MIKALIFDLDETLYNEYEYKISGLKKVDEYIFYNNLAYKNCFLFNAIELLSKKGQLYPYIITDVLKKIKIYDNKIEKYLIELFCNHFPNISLYNDFIEILPTLKKYKLALITDGSSLCQWNKINALGLQNIMDYIIVTNDYGSDWHKPSIKPFKSVLDKFKVSSSEVINIGDNPNKDFQGANALGISSLRIKIGYYKKTKINNQFDIISFQDYSHLNKFLKMC